MALLLLVGLSASSCELFKPLSQADKPGGQGSRSTTTTAPTQTPNEELDPIQARRVYDAKTGTWVVVQNSPTDQMDTIIWKDIPSSTDPPIYSTSAPIEGPSGNPVRPIGTGEGGSQLLSSYNVSVVLPFLSNRYDRLDKTLSDNSEWAMQYYSGMQMAYDELEANGVALNLQLLDSKFSEQTVSNLVRTDRTLNSAHLIIGPYGSGSARILADRAKTGSSVLVSPHSASARVSQDNPNYIQVNPTLQSHCEAIMQHVNQRYNRSQIVLVAMDTPGEQARFDYFQREYQRLNGMIDTTRLTELLIDTTKLDLQNFDLKPFLGYSGETVFIVPSWANEIFVYNLMRKIDLDRNEYQRVTIYGMPQWMNYERIDFDYFEKLNVHVSSSAFIDDFNPDIRRFKRQFYERYGTIPNSEAFVGYDVMRYFGRMLHEHGTRFQAQLPENSESLLHTTFDFQPVVPASATALERPVVQRWENKFVNILKFQDFRFSKAN